jgi:PA domain
MSAILPELLPDQATLERWENYMVGLGPRLDGSAALRSWHDFLATELAAAGLDVRREPTERFEWWEHTASSLTLIDGAERTPVQVGAHYPYSGYTRPGGVIGRIVDAGAGLPLDFALGDFRGKIAFVQFDLPCLRAGCFYPSASYIHDPDHTFTPFTSYKRAWTAVLSPEISIIDPPFTTSLRAASRAGAIGVIISFDGSFDNTRGQYLPFNGWPGNSAHVPALYVDRATGNRIKARIAQGTQARLELCVQKHVDSRTDDIIATLPGRRADQVIIVNSHTDGTSEAEENGGLGVVALARYFASLPDAPPRKMVFALVPGHFYGGIHGDTARFIANHPEIIARAVGSLSIEHLGQTEWLDEGGGLHATGRCELAILFGSATPIQRLMKNAVVDEDLRRTIVSRPILGTYFGVGAALHAAGVPNASYITGPNMLCSSADNQHLDKFSVERMAAELRMCAHLAAALGAEPVESLRGTADPGWSLGLWRASTLRRFLWRTALKRRHL